MDLMAEMDPDKWAKPKPSDFWKVLEQLGYNFDYLDSFTVADSHSAAAPSLIHALEYDTPDYIINFDAHHDLGYCEWERINQMLKDEVCTCDMWLCAVLDWVKEDNVGARVVYPNWLREETSIERQWKHLEDRLPQEFLDRVELGFFENEDGSVSDVVCKPGETIEVQSLFICRSGAWTPPWLDKQFVDFVEGAEQISDVEAQEFKADQITEFEAMKPRGFSVEAAEKLADQWREMMKPKKPRS